MHLFKHTIKYRLLVFIVGLVGFMMQSCNMTDEFSVTESTEKVYLSVTRSQGPYASFNQDRVDFEDRVHDLAMLVFDSRTGQLICDYYETAISQKEVSNSFQVEMSPGQRNFFFFANSSIDELKKIRNQSELQEYMTKLKSLDTDLYHNASQIKGFPMSATYLNQVVEGGGTEQNPKPFYPNNQDKIYLHRVVAKVEVELEGVTTDDIKSIKYVNGVKEFSFTTLPHQVKKTPVEKEMNWQAKQKFQIYIPEVILAENEKWSDANTHINYIEIIFSNHKKHLIPIISNGSLQTKSYLTFAKGEENENPTQPDYNIYRDTHYKLKAVVSRESRSLDVNLQVSPWKVVSSQFNFDKPVYHIETYPAAKERMIELHQQEKAKVKFKLTSPAGALWQSSITNGLFFELLPVPQSELLANEVSGTLGVTSEHKTYVFYVRPKQPYNYTTQYTELYITVNGKEIPLTANTTEAEGTKHRFIFKQIE